MSRNIALYPWFRFCHGLIFWQAVWFLFFQARLGPADAILLYAISDIATTVLEVPSGYMSDRLGRRGTLIAATLAGVVGAALIVLGDGFLIFAVAQVALGASMAFISGTDSALLYEALAAEGRADEMEAQELRAWRFSFVALALSAVSGGAMSLIAPALPFAAGLIVFVAMLAVALQFREPPHRRAETPQPILPALRTALRKPVLTWLFVLSVLMYGFSHLPFVFGQPFILAALTDRGLAAEAPLVSGAVSSTMMVISVLASLLALRLRKKLGLVAILLLAFAMQIGLVAVLALSQSALAIAFLFLRMVPDSLSRPFIQARIQPLLADDSRATYMSVQSLGGRLLLAGSLMLAAGAAGDPGVLGHDAMAQILLWYVAAGLIGFALLWGSARRAGVATGD